jgi:putative oxidoreductase
MNLGKKLLRLEQDVVLLAVRLLLGSVLVAHGWQKLNDFGHQGTTTGFTQMGVPNADIAAAFAIAAELGGGALLLAGLLTPIAALAVVADMAGAFWYAHRGTEVFVGEGGWELVAVIAAGALALFAVGAGRISVDGIALGVLRRRKRRKAAAKATAQAPASDVTVLERIEALDAADAEAAQADSAQADSPRVDSSKADASSR